MMHLGTYTEHLNKRAFSIEKRIAQDATAPARPEQQRKMKAKFGQTEFLADDLLTLRELKKSFGERTLFRPRLPPGGAGATGSPFWGTTAPASPPY